MKPQAGPKTNVENKIPARQKEKESITSRGQHRIKTFIFPNQSKPISSTEHQSSNSVSPAPWARPASCDSHAEVKQLTTIAETCTMTENNRYALSWREKRRRAHNPGQQLADAHRGGEAFRTVGGLLAVCGSDSCYF
ncbi:hypothetical protein EYF80_031007 [Liparis tanakae]|uniref:Uncharacterized protein n=1 Tax=Liparis tanakae TaxID=230148 RepID=A0A4Z2H1J4_9TELE|nr:hypothetical protein EYF80_031007 [Liparis tanakae]